MANQTLINRLRYQWLKLGLYINRLTETIEKVDINGTRFMMQVASARELSRVRTYSTKEPQTLLWIDQNLQAGDVFYDIGANIGQYGLYAAQKVGPELSVLCFEPESQNYAALNKNIYLNQLSQSVKAYCLAVAGETAIADFNVVGVLAEGHALHQFASLTDEMGRSFTPAHIQGMMGVSLDDLVYKYGLECPTHIKIDVDGNEPQIMKGAKKTLRDPRLKSVLIEINPGNMQTGIEASSIHASLRQNGFNEVGSLRSTTSGAENAGLNVVFSRT